MAFVISQPIAWSQAAYSHDPAPVCEPNHHQSQDQITPTEQSNQNDINRRDANQKELSEGQAERREKPSPDASPEPSPMQNRENVESSRSSSDLNQSEQLNEPAE